MLHSPKFWKLVLVAIVVGALGGTWAFFDTMYGGNLFQWQWSKVIVVAVGGGVLIGVVSGLVHRSRRQ